MSIINIAKKKSYHSQIALRHTSESSQPRTMCTSTRYTRVHDIRPQLSPASSKESSYFSAGEQLNNRQFCFLPSPPLFHRASKEEEEIILKPDDLT